jgi:hypothetical protein
MLSLLKLCPLKQLSDKGARIVSSVGLRNLLRKIHQVDGWGKAGERIRRQMLATFMDFTVVFLEFIL